MDAIKDNLYTCEETQLSMTAKAIAHPARVKILRMLNDDCFGCRNIDLAHMLNFSRPNIKNHLQFMKEADLLEIEYFVHYYNIKLNKKGKELASMIFSRNGTN